MEDFLYNGVFVFPTGKKTLLIRQATLAVNIPLFMIDSIYIYIFVCSDCRISEV